MPFRSCTAIIVALMLAGGCALTSVQGKRQADPSSAVEVLALVFDDTRVFVPKDPKAGPVIGARDAEENQRALAWSIQQSFPAAFAEHGIRLQVYLRSAGAAGLEQYRRDAAGRRHVMHLVPTEASTHTRGGSTTLSMNASLVELYPQRTLWTGSLSVLRPVTAKMDTGVASEFAGKLIAQLRKDGIIGTPVQKPAAAAAPAPVPTLRSVQDVAAVPLLSERGRDLYRDWLTKKPPRAFVIAEGGAANATWGTNPKNAEDPRDPAERALAHCRKRGLQDCRLYAVDDRVVWPDLNQKLK